MKIIFDEDDALMVAKAMALHYTREADRKRMAKASGSMMQRGLA